MQVIVDKVHAQQRENYADGDAPHDLYCKIAVRDSRSGVLSHSVTEPLKFAAIAFRRLAFPRRFVMGHRLSLCG